MPKFFVDKGQITDNLAYITGEDISHLTRVLRAEIGDEITLCDGDGTDFETVIEEISKDKVTLKILSSDTCEAEPKTEVVLFQALPKQGKMEYIIQKTTELGISKVVPVYTKRCVVKPTDKLSRWQKIADESVKQCKRGKIPQITPTVSFDEALKMLEQLETKIILYEGKSTNRLKDILHDKKINQIGILVGPEGGFSEEEVEMAQEKGILSVTLGERILRTETAAAAVLPVIMYSQDEF